MGYRKVSMMDRPYRSSLWKELVIRQRPAVGSPTWKLWALSREVRSCLASWEWKLGTLKKFSYPHCLFQHNRGKSRYIGLPS